MSDRWVDRALERPPLVEEGLARARRLGFGRSCVDDVGRLLRTLAASLPLSSVAGEIGSGCGVGSAWILSGLGSGSRLVTVENDPSRADAARLLLTACPNATVISGDWNEILRYGPFHLLFVDAAAAKAQPETILSALALKGIAVFDDLPGRWPEEPKPDVVRDFWLRHPAVISAEIGIDYGPDGYPGSAIVAVRVR